MERRSLTILGAVALLLGAGTPMLASASEDYQQLGTVEEGVYEVASDEQRLRVQAEQPVDLVVRGLDGDVVDARAMDAGEERTVVLDDEQAFVALNGGQAALEAKGDGEVRPLETQREEVRLVQADGSSVERSFTVQVPDGALLGWAHLEGEASQVDATGIADGERVLDADRQALEDEARLEPKFVRSQALDVHVSAERLDGTLALEFAILQAIGDDDLNASAGALPVDDEAYNATVDLHELAYEPIEFTVPAGEDAGLLVADIEEGYVFDASLYSANGSQVSHLHAGESLAEARDHCDYSMECPRGYEERRQLAPHVLEHELAPGDYVLFVRHASVRGTLTLEDPGGEALLPDAEPRNLSMVEVVDDRQLSIQQPVLDVWRTWSHSEGEVQPRTEVKIDDELVYRHQAMAQGSGYEMRSETEMHPSLLEAGNVTVSLDSATDELWSAQRGIQLVLLGD